MGSSRRENESQHQEFPEADGQCQAVLIRFTAFLNRLPRLATPIRKSLSSNDYETRSTGMGGTGCFKNRSPRAS